MSDWPSYATLPPDYVHAIGIISLNYNAYEESLFGLFRIHLERRGLTRNLTEFLYGALNRPDQMGSLQKIFETYEPDHAVTAAVLHVLKHFQWTFESRNLVMHSVADFITNELELPTAEFRKRSSKDFSKLNLLKFSLSELRTIADEIHKGHEFLKGVYIYVANREDVLPALTRAFVNLNGPPTLPQIFPVPAPIAVLDHPLNRAGEKGPPQPSQT
jgi:hypothetical protein